MAEYWDVYDENRLPTGRLHQRGIPLAAGDYHLVVRGWILDDQGYLLLSRRDPAKPFGGYWECTGGSVTAGEDSFAGVRREIAEEVGIDVSSASVYFLRSVQRKDSFLDSWLFQLPGRQPVTLQPGETVDFRWVSLAEYRRMKENNEIVPVLEGFPLVEYAVTHWINPKQEE